MLNEADLIKLSHEVDGVLEKMLLEYEISPLPLIAIICARMMHLAQAADVESGYKQLLQQVAANTFAKSNQLYPRH